ncbi:Na+/H+ antiporter subunit E [Arcanobacterium hippocoleae]
MGAIIWLTIVWVLLWGDPSTANFVSGFLLALFITTVAPFPATPFDGRFRPLGVLRLLVIFSSILCGHQFCRRALFCAERNQTGRLFGCSCVRILTFI